MDRFYDVVDALENAGKVVKSVMFEDGTTMDIEEVCGNEDKIISVETVPVDAYEANGYDVSGLKGEWSSIK